MGCQLPIKLGSIVRHLSGFTGLVIEARFNVKDENKCVNIEYLIQQDWRKVWYSVDELEGVE